MSTVNISLTQDQVKFLDQASDKFGFANRSEFVRSIIRLIMHKPEIISQSSSFPFISPNTVSKKQILKEFKKEGYSKEFLKDLEEGLASSQHFT